MIARILIGLVIVGVIIGAVILGQGSSAALVQPGASTPSEVPGYSARNAEVIETGPDGKPAFTVNARVVRQRPDDDRIQLDGPRMVFVTQEGGTWHAQSRAGQIHADGSVVELFGDVKMNGDLSGTPVTIGTSTLSFDTTTEIAKTPAGVTFDSNGNRLAATGLLANLKDGSVRLESRVHGTFPPK